jgi:hypothetical protein
MPWAWSDELEAIHTHRWPNVQYVLSSPDFIRRDGEGTVLLDTRIAQSRPAPPVILWSEPLPPHSIENVGEADLHVIMVELKG